MIKFTDTEKKLITESWNKVMEQPIEIQLLHYDKLFELGGPELKKLFEKSDLNFQIQRIIAEVTMDVCALEMKGYLEKSLKDLGTRHQGVHKVKKEWFEYSRISFIYMVETALGKDWTPDVKEAWIKFWGHVNDCMLNGYH